MKTRRGISSGEIGGILVMVVGLSLVAIVIGAILPTGLGFLANKSSSNVNVSGNAMKNVDTSTKSLFNLLPLFIVLGIVFTIIGVVLLVFRGR